MKLPEYVKTLTDILKYEPGAKDLVVVAPIDHEGNGHLEVHYGPTVGIWDNNEFEVLDIDDPDSKHTDEDVNCICVI